MAHNTIANIVYETSEAIWNTYCLKHMAIPTTDDFYKIANEFEHLWNFPNCVGCVDGKHVRIKCPNNTGSQFYNYKKYFSIHLQGIADANYKFITVDIGAYGRQSDSGVFTTTNVFHCLETNTFNLPADRKISNTDVILPFVLLGDQGYPLKKYLMRPYPADDNITNDKDIFNYRLSRARRTVECAFGILVNKWRCLKTELQVYPNHVDTIVKCVCLLHNIIIDKEGIHDIASEISTNEKSLYNGNRGVRRFNRSTREAYEIRDKFKQYFNTVGAIEHQYNI